MTPGPDPGSLTPGPGCPAEITALEDQLGSVQTELNNLPEIQVEEEQFLKYRKYFRIVFAKHASQIRAAPFEVRQKLLSGMINGDIIVPEDHDLSKMRISWQHNLRLLRLLFPFLPDPDDGGPSTPKTPDKFLHGQSGSQGSVPPAGTLNGFLNDHGGCHRHVFPHYIPWGILRDPGPWGMPRRGAGGRSTPKNLVDRIHRECAILKADRLTRPRIDWL